ncbi:MAG: transglutaminase domain-containing protein, partial [Frankiales bacterium]|nr:transglutaminase domain-containing protein [Frankiales bacterium]
SSPTRQISTTIRLSGQLDGPWLPSPIRTDEVDVPGPWLWDAEAETVFSTRTSLIELQDSYTVTAARPEPSVELLRSPQSVPPDIAKAYAQRPKLSPYVLAQIDQAVEGKRTDYDRVVALQAFFREDPLFTYDEQATEPGINSPNALENFLRGKRGFCEQYASAMAAMVRGLGLPARVAVGFTPGTREGKEYVVTTSEAHAWPEVWFQGAGWIRFEPTPRTDNQESTPSYSTPPAEQAPDPSVSTTPSTAPSTTPALPQGPSAVDRGADGATGPTAGDNGSGGPSPWVLLVPLALLVLAGPRLLALLRTRRRWARPGPVTAWAQLLDDAADVGHRWRPADSPRAAAAQLQASRSLSGPAAAALLRLAGAVERARYALPGEREDAVMLRRDAATVRAALLSRADRRTRLLAVLAPVSTLRWASQSVGGAVADALDRLDQLTTSLGAWVRHPRTRRA